MIWSLNPNFLFNLIPFRYKLKNLKRKKFFLTLHHFVFKKKFLVNNHYIQCHDPSMITYRVTLYSNIRSKKFDKNKKNYHLTLEVISTNKKINLIKLEKKALNEVYKMGVIEEHQNPIYKFSEISANPIIPTIDIINEDIKKYNFLNKKISNIYFTSLPYYNFHTGSILKNIYKKFLKN